MHMLCYIPRLLDVPCFRALLPHATASFDRETEPAHIAFSVRGGSTIQYGAIDVLKLRLQAMHWVHDRERRRRGTTQGDGKRPFKHRRKLQGLKARHLRKKIYAVCFALEIKGHDPGIRAVRIVKACDVRFAAHCLSECPDRLDRPHDIDILASRRAIDSGRSGVRYPERFGPVI